MKINLQDIANALVLISAVIIAAKNIFGFFKKPVDIVGTKMHEAEESHIKDVIKQEVPNLLTQQKNERQKEIQLMINGLEDAITQTIDDKFEDLTAIVLDQGKEIKDIRDTLEKVKDSSKDVLRIRMNEIYYKYLPFRKICDSDKQLFDSLYSDYASLDGNSGWKKMNLVVQDWTVVSDDYKFEQDI